MQNLEDHCLLGTYITANFTLSKSHSEKNFWQKGCIKTLKNKHSYRIAGKFRGQKFSRFKGKSVWNDFCNFYFRDFKWTDLWISFGIIYCSFYFRDSVYSREIAKIRTQRKFPTIRYSTYYACTSIFSTLYWWVLLLL